MSSVAHRGYVHVGMDVSKDAIAVAVLPPDRDVAEVDKIQGVSRVAVLEPEEQADVLDRIQAIPAASALSCSARCG